MLDNGRFKRYIYVMSKVVNAAKLAEWINRNEDGMSRLMGATGLSFWTIDRMRRGKYQSEPGKPTKRALCAATGLSEHELFPSLAEDGEAS